MEMTIKQLASELGVSKPTVRSVIAELGFHDKLRKVGNRYMLSDMQISEIKSKMSNKSENEVHSELEKTEKSKNEIQPKSEKTEKSESEVQLKSEKTENNIFIEQLLNKQLAVKDEQITMFQAQLAVKDRQINLLQEQISQLTAAMENLTASLNAEQALHAGTIQKQLAEHSVMDQPSDVEQPKQKQGLFSRLFGRKEN
ncbi:MAG: hypothetical protein IIT46_15745 [Lachnospiraceae bacterium]|jgi:DeoR/GlpR family transcriptional regulator of sugar metabolism|nr:hypothetical protein [Lachnospiraceae bacterium]